MLISGTLLLHAKQHWPNYITVMMWPFALKEATYCLNQLSLRTDGGSCEEPFSMLIRIYLIQQCITFLDHPVLCWTCSFNWALQALQSGNHNHDSEYMLVIPHCMLVPLLWSSILAGDTFPHSFTWYLMIYSLRSHTWKAASFHPTGLILLITHKRK
jgi:hypothetical protein